MGCRCCITHLKQYWRASYRNVLQYYPTIVECFSWFHAWSIEGLKMNFRKLIGIFKPQNSDLLFSYIVRYDHIKRLFGMALKSDSGTHILLTGSPASAKTMFLTSLLQFLKNAYFVDGGNTTKSGMIDYLFENRPVIC